MSVQFLKSAGLSVMTSQTDTPSTKKRRIPWYVYFLGSSIYTALAGWLSAESSPLTWVCLISAPVGLFLCLGSLEKRETRLGVQSKPCVIASPTMARWTQSTPHMPGC